MPTVEASELQTTCRGEEQITVCYPKPTHSHSNKYHCKKKLYKNPSQTATEWGTYYFTLL